MWNVFFKELLELTRDKRTLVFMLVMPALIVPALLFGYAWVAGSMELKENAKVLKYSVIASDGAPALKQLLASDKHLQYVVINSEKDAWTAIKKSELDFAVVYEPGGEAGILAGANYNLSLRYNTAIAFDGVGKRIKPILTGRYTQLLREKELLAAGVTAASVGAINMPFDVTVQSTVASDRERQGEMLGAMLPYILLMMGLGASASVAVDMGAGEKERGTLESLLLLPIPRSSIVVAKFLVILMVGAISGTIGVTSLGLCATFLLQASGMDVLSSIAEFAHVRDFFLLGLLMLPAYGIVAALQLSISIFSRSHKEAAGYSNQLMIFIIIPLLISMLPGMKLSDGWSLVPITNISLSVKEIIKGTPNLIDCVVVLSSTTLVACALLVFCVSWCKRESVLFRS